MNNTIILKKGEARLTGWEQIEFKQGDTIWGADQNPEELKRWSIEEKEEAKDELTKYRCSYKLDGNIWNIKEYALEYCNCDEEGEFIEGSDYDLANEEILTDYSEDEKKELINLFRKGYIETEKDAELFWKCHNDGADTDLTIDLCNFDKNYILPRVEVYIYDEEHIDEEEADKFIQVSDEDFLRLGDKCRFYYNDNDFESFDDMMYKYEHE